MKSELNILRDEYNEIKIQSDNYERDVGVYTAKIDQLKTSFQDLSEKLNVAKEAVEYYKKLTRKEIEKENELNEKIAHQKSEISVSFFFFIKFYL